MGELIKRCNTCGEEKAHSEFYKGNPKHTDKFGLTGRCKICDSKRAQKWRDENPDKVKENSRIANLRRYGLTEDDYERMYKDQNGLCALCGESPEGKGRWGKLAIDHCHDTEKIRALLCPPCNSGLGYFKHDKIKLLQAIFYLEAHQ